MLPESIYERSVEQAAEQPGRCIDTLLDTFETAWMGQPKTAKSALSSLLQEDSASVANASHTLSCSGGASPQSLGRSNKNASGPPSGSYRGTSTGMAMASKRPHEEEDDEDAQLSMLPMTPFPSHMLLHGKAPNGGAMAATTAPSAVVPVPVPASALGMKAAPGQQHLGEFAPVFFSPIPLSYLNLAHSESESSFLDATGSPDVTLRGGRLAKTGSGDWADGVGVASSPGAAGSPLSTSLQQRSRLADGGVPSFPLSSINENGLVGISGQQKGLQQQQPQLQQLGSLSGSGTQRGSARAGRGAANGSRASSGSPTSLLHPLLSRPPVQPAVQPVAAAVAAAHVSGGSAVQITPFGMVQQMDGGGGGVGMLAAGAGSISIAAAASAKRNSQWGTLRLVAGMAMIPHVDKVRGTNKRVPCIG